MVAGFAGKLLRRKNFCCGGLVWTNESAAAAKQFTCVCHFVGAQASGRTGSGEKSFAV